MPGFLCSWGMPDTQQIPNHTKIPVESLFP